MPHFSKLILFSICGPALLSPFCPAVASTLDVYNGLIEKSDRVKNIRYLCDYLTEAYSGIELKKHTKYREGYFEKKDLLTEFQAQYLADQPIADIPKICEAAILLEESIDDPATHSIDASAISDQFLRSQANLKYLDRVDAFAARIKDGHLKIQKKGPRTRIRMGLNFTVRENKVVVTERLPQYLSVSKQCPSQDLPSPGDQLIAIDDQSAENILDEFVQYQSEGSYRKAKLEAAWSIGSREFRYPENAIQSFTFKNKTRTWSCHFSWVYDAGKSEAFSKDDLSYFHFKGFLPTRETLYQKTTDNQWIRKNSESYAIIFDDVLKDSFGNKLSDVEIYLSDDTNELLWMTAELENGLSYLGLFTFDLKSSSTFDILKLKKDENKNITSETLSKIDVLTAFRKSIERLNTHQKLIIDTRKNYGGSPAFAADIALAISDSNQIIHSASRFNSINWVNQFQVFFNTHEALLPGVWNPFGYSNDWIDPEAPEAMEAALEKEIKNRSIYGPIITYRSRNGEGILNSVRSRWLLIGPNCVSACEGFAAVLQTSKVAKLIGTPTAGTGMGFTGLPGFFHTPGIFNIRVTNTFFGPPIIHSPKNSHAHGIFSNFSDSEKEMLTSENRPIQPDLWVEPTVKDLTQHNSDLLNFIANHSLQH